MDRREFTDALRAILAARSDGVAARLARFQVHAAAHDVDGIVIEVFLDQDGEGPFDVWARFDGADAFALDRRFDEERHLFGVEWGEDGWHPEVPGRPRGWTRDDLEHVLIAVVAEWIRPLLPAGSPEGFWLVDDEAPAS